MTSAQRVWLTAGPATGCNVDWPRCRSGAAETYSMMPALRRATLSPSAVASSRIQQIDELLVNAAIGEDQRPLTWTFIVELRGIEPIENLHK